MPSRFLKEIPEGLTEELEEAPKKVYSFDFTQEKKPAMGQSSFFSGGFGSASKAAEKSAASGESFKAGDRIRHRKFGDGTVLEAKAIGADTFLRVEFDSVGEKKLMAAYVKLERID